MGTVKADFKGQKDDIYKLYQMALNDPNCSFDTDYYEGPYEMEDWTGKVYYWLTVFVKIE